MVQSAAWRKWGAVFAIGAAVGFSATVGVADEEGVDPPAPKIEIRPFGGGGFGGIGLPKEFEEMMKAAQQMAELQAKYQAAVDELIAAAKDLEQAENLMESVTKVAKLAKQSGEIKAEIAKKQEEMTKKIGGGAIGIGGFGGIGGPLEGAIKILPAIPQIEIDGERIEVEAPESEE